MQSPVIRIASRLVLSRRSPGDSIYNPRPVADGPIGFVTDTFIDPRVIQLEFNGYPL